MNSVVDVVVVFCLVGLCWRPSVAVTRLDPCRLFGTVQTMSVMNLCYSMFTKTDIHRFIKPRRGWEADKHDLTGNNSSHFLLHDAKYFVALSAKVDWSSFLSLPLEGLKRGGVRMPDVELDFCHSKCWLFWWLLSFEKLSHLVAKLDLGSHIT